MAGKQDVTRASFFAWPAFLLTAFYCIPVLLPSLFGWMPGVLAVPVAYLLAEEGFKQSRITLSGSLFVAGLVGFFTGRLIFFLGILPVIPLGYSLYLSGQKKQNPAQAALYGVLTLSGCLFLFWILYGLGSDIHPYRQLLHLIDAGFVSAGDIYRQNGDVPLEMQEELAAVLASLRELIPKILPGLLISMILVTVWMNQVLWNGLLLRVLPKRAPWPPYSSWHLPEQIVWLPIVAAAGYIFGPESWKTIALNGIIVSGVIYFFQGLAVFLHMLARWKVPGYFRILLYGMLVIQSYGLILLSLLGVADIWLNLRPGFGDLDTPDPENS